MTDLVTLNVREEPLGTAVVAAVGEIDLSNCDQLDLALDSLNGAHRVVVDLSLCSFFDSSCLAVLSRHARRLREEGKEFAVSVDAQGHRVIELARLTELLGSTTSTSSVLPKFRAELAAAATGMDLSSAVAVIHAAGGIEVSVLQANDKPRVEFTVEAEDERRAAVAAGRVCQALSQATTSLEGGWLLVSLLLA
jgi:anti-sigma B factor antagonist